ncbi:MAG: DUF433 domain-containing protein [Gemmataceae bacterium]
MSQIIAIVDHGRGPQLSTSRITVLDLVPYFQAEDPIERILRWLPTLSETEIAIAHAYYLQNQEEMDRQDAAATAYRKEQIRRQRLRFPEEDPEERRRRLHEWLRQRKQETSDVQHPG